MVTRVDFSSGVNDDGDTLGAVADFAKHGLSSAALSAGISIANTGIALSNTFGTDFRKMDTYNTLDNWGLEETSQYYRDHETAIDPVGFIAVSLIPGTLAIKGLRAAQKSISTSARVSTGLRRALVPNKQLATVAKAVKEQSYNTAFGTLQDTKIKSIVAGFHQQALEAAAFEGAVLLTMNQNPIMTKEDMTYFEGIGENLGHAGFGLVLGTGIGGIFEGVANVGAAKAMLREAEQLNKDAIKVFNEGIRNGVVKGDATVAPLTTYMQTKARMAGDTFETLDKGVKLNIDQQLRQSREHFQLDLLELAGGNVERRDAIFKIVDDMDSLDDAVNLLSGVKKYAGFHEKDVLFDVPSTTVEHVLIDDAVEAQFHRLKGTGQAQTRAEIKMRLVDGGTSCFMLNGTLPSDLHGIRGFSILDNQHRELDWNHILALRLESGNVLLS